MDDPRGSRGRAPWLREGENHLSAKRLQRGRRNPNRLGKVELPVLVYTMTEGRRTSLVAKASHSVDASIIVGESHKIWDCRRPETAKAVEGPNRGDTGRSRRATPASVTMRIRRPHGNERVADGNAGNGVERSPPGQFRFAPGSQPKDPKGSWTRYATGQSICFRAG